MNEELINRIDDWQSKLDGFDYFDSVEAERLIADCRTVLSQSEPVRYVPMTDDAWEKLYAEYEAICFDKSPSPRYIEAEVISRAIAQGAKLEVANEYDIE